MRSPPPPTTTTPPPPTPTATTRASTTSTIPALPPPETFDDGTEFVFEVADPADPSLPVGSAPWDNRFSYSPWVVLRDGRYHMFYTGWGIGVAIGHAVSDDGVRFVRSGADPIVEIRESIGGRTVFAQAPVVWVEEDGTWVMVFGELVSKRFNGRSLHRATAPAPEGPWAVDADPIYTVDPTSWENEIVPQSAVHGADGVVLLYDTRGAGSPRTGALLSSDGRTFAPHDDPATAQPTDPVMGESPVQAWDGGGVGSPVIVATETGFAAFYVGLEGPEAAPGPRHLRVGYAVSDDGTRWRRLAGNPSDRAGHRDGLACQSRLPVARRRRRGGRCSHLLRHPGGRTRHRDDRGDRLKAAGRLAA